MTPNKKSIALFIPCYNEEKRIRIKEFKTFIKTNEYKIDFFFIDDGSKDATKQLLLGHLVDDINVFLIVLNKNHGKGNALRKAILQSLDRPYSYYGFIDADLDIPLEQINKLYISIEKSPFLLAISKRALYRNVSILKLRTIGSVVMVYLANYIIGFKPGLQDTQCGCKLFKREIIEPCFRREFLSEWLFDIEIFLRLKNFNSTPRNIICEVPLEDLGNSGKSNFRYFQNLRIIKQLYDIKRMYRYNE